VTEPLAPQVALDRVVGAIPPARRQALGAEIALLRSCAASPERKARSRRASELFEANFSTGEAPRRVVGWDDLQALTLRPEGSLRASFSTGRGFVSFKRAGMRVYLARIGPSDGKVTDPWVTWPQWALPGEWELKQRLS